MLSAFPWQCQTKITSSVFQSLLLHGQIVKGRAYESVILFKAGQKIMSHTKTAPVCVSRQQLFDLFYAAGQSTYPFDVVTYAMFRQRPQKSPESCCIIATAVYFLSRTELEIWKTNILEEMSRVRPLHPPALLLSILRCIPVFLSLRTTEG